MRENVERVARLIFEICFSLRFWAVRLSVFTVRCDFQALEKGVSHACRWGVVELTRACSSYLFLRDALVSHASGQVNSGSGQVTEGGGLY